MYKYFKHLLVLLVLSSALASSGYAQLDIEDRIRGLILGSMIGDAAGGPLEYAPVDWQKDSLLQSPLKDHSKKQLGNRFRLRDYPMEAAPYAQWIDYAPAGTITDDSRYKVLLMRSVLQNDTLSRQGFLQTLITYANQPHAEHDSLKNAWLQEYMYRWRWLSGDTTHTKAYPPERIWGGVATMAGQMPLLPVAAFYPGRPRQAYLKSWELNLMDTGYGKDMTGALVAGLSVALTDTTPGWEDIIETMRNTDPYGFSEVPWVPRRFDIWLKRAFEEAARADDIPIAAFQNLKSRLNAVTWWEARVPMVITFGIFELTDYHPLASMELALAFGKDTDSTAQLMGAFLGARYGAGIFPEKMRTTVETRLKEQYDVDLNNWVQTIMKLSPHQYSY